ncbi:hypothetical protein [Azohydromonas lata]|uniref:Uncharacterized protein n=1 Tax=Azohydromonas lata TaxID=45677 RepID=A0ABU5IFY0_9BURK|nr:hypothetical protein [Azohydromonas lata]MDZ5456858.1 hypothetical protein [Azohydromonas lata]
MSRRYAADYVRAWHALLRHPGLRQLEEAWHGLDFLVRRVETGSRLMVERPWAEARHGGLQHALKTAGG